MNYKLPEAIGEFIKRTLNTRKEQQSITSEHGHEDSDDEFFSATECDVEQDTDERTQSDEITNSAHDA